MGTLIRTGYSNNTHRLIDMHCTPIQSGLLRDRGKALYVVNSPKPAFISISPRADPHPTYLTEETGPILSHSRPWHMDWNPAHSGCWPKVWGCRSCGKCTLTTEEWAQWELVDHMRSTCLGIFLFLGGGAHLQAPPPTQPRPITPQRVEKYLS